MKISNEILIGILIGLWYGAMLVEPYKSWVLIIGIIILGITTIILTIFTILVKINDFKCKRHNNE